MRNAGSDNESSLRDSGSKISIRDDETQNTQSEVETEASLPDSPEKDWDGRNDRDESEPYRSEGRSETRSETRSESRSESRGHMRHNDSESERSRSDFNQFNPDMKDPNNTFTEYDDISESTTSRTTSYQVPDLDGMVRDCRKISGTIYNKYWPRMGDTLIPRLTPESKIMATFKLRKFKKLHKLMSSKSESSSSNVIRFSRKSNGYD